MEGFKPLLKINGFPMIAMTVQSMRNAGIRDITVVTGYRGEELKKVLEPLGVWIIENRRLAGNGYAGFCEAGAGGCG